MEGKKGYSRMWLTALRLDATTPSPFKNIYIYNVHTCLLSSKFILSKGDDNDHYDVRYAKVFWKIMQTHKVFSLSPISHHRANRTAGVDLRVLFGLLDIYIYISVEWG